MTAVRTGSARAPFIGRRFELAELVQALEGARSSHGRLLLLSGDAGAGKTRLASALAEAADLTEARVHWGACRQRGARLPFGPWAQVVRAELATLEPHERQKVPIHLALLAPELRASDGPGAAPLGPDFQGARSALFAAVTAFLVERSAQGGMVVVLDDLHAADHASLMLLQHVARDVSDSHLLIVGTYRDSELRSSPALHRAMSAVASRSRRMTVTGLQEDDVATLLEHTTGSSPAEQLARLVHHTTDGNPLFVEQVGRLLEAEAGKDQVSLPEDGYAVLRRRLELVPADLRKTLAAASVLGCQFGIIPLAAVVGRSTDQILDVLSEGQRLEVVEEAGAGQFRFTHALWAEVLDDELRPSERVALHRRADAAILDDDVGGASERAHHSYCAARGGDGRQAVRWCTAAGDQATEALAFEEAAILYGRALEALALSPPVDERRRYELLMALAGSQERAGDAPLARQSYQRAMKAARTVGSPDLLARAAIRSVADETDVAVIEEALAALPPGDSPERAELLGLLGCHRPSDRGLALGREGVAMARRLGDPQTLRAVLSHWHRRVDGCPDAPEVAAELIQLAAAAGDGPGRVLARLTLAYDLCVTGDIDLMAAELETAALESEALQAPSLTWGVAVEQAGLALLRGDLDAAERHARRALATGERAGVSGAEEIGAGQLSEVLRHRGEWSRLDAAKCPATMLGLAAAHSGDAGEARRVLLRRPTTWWDAVNLSETAWVLDAAEGVELPYDALHPLARRHLVTEETHISLGSADRYLGQMATLLGRFEDAEGYFQAAHRLHARLRSPLWDAYTCADHARMLLRRNQRGDRDVANELAEAAWRGFRSLGMEYQQRRVEEMLGRRAADPATAQVVVADHARLCQEGEYWLLEYAGEAARLRDSKGLRYLGQLLRTPGREHHALDLVVGGGRGARPVDLEVVPGGAGDAGVVLDDKAKSAYRARLEDLREELDEAAAGNDLGRAERAQTEIDFLLAELAGAVGLGGRDRRAASDAERARQSVTRAVKGALERVAEAHPALGDHLRSTVRTGVFSAYAPDPRAPITWDG